MTHSTNTTDISILSIDKLLKIDERACRDRRKQRFNALVDGLAYLFRRELAAHQFDYAETLIVGMTKRFRRIEDCRPLKGFEDEIGSIEGQPHTTAWCERIVSEAAGLMVTAGLTTDKERKAIREAANRIRGEIAADAANAGLDRG